VKRLVPAALFFVLLVPLGAAAQMVKCVDQRGRTHYTDKPEADCKGAKSTTTIAPPPGSAAPAPPVPPPQKSSKAAPAKAPGPQAKAGSKGRTLPRTEQEERKFRDDCKSSQDMLDWLGTPAGQKAENHAARVEMIKRSMRNCP
jgi:hypothetical protein